MKNKILGINENNVGKMNSDSENEILYSLQRTKAEDYI